MCTLVSPTVNRLQLSPDVEFSLVKKRIFHLQSFEDICSNNSIIFYMFFLKFSLTFKSLSHSHDYLWIFTFADYLQFTTENSATLIKIEKKFKNSYSPALSFRDATINQDFITFSFSIIEFIIFSVKSHCRWKIINYSKEEKHWF